MLMTYQVATCSSVGNKHNDNDNQEFENFIERASSNTRTKNNIINNKANKTTANGDILVKLL